MAKTYNKIDWTEETPITPQNLNHMDDAIKELYDDGIANITDKILNSKSNSTENTYSCDYINKLHAYSTEEKVIGIWEKEDGTKVPLYRKIIRYSGNFTFYTKINHYISNLDEICNINAKYTIANGVTRIIPSAYSNTGTLVTNNFYCFIYDISSIEIGVCLSQFVIDNINKLTITIEYTKTTD